MWLTLIRKICAHLLFIAALIGCTEDSYHDIICRIETLETEFVGVNPSESIRMRSVALDSWYDDCGGLVDHQDSPKPEYSLNVKMQFDDSPAIIGKNTIVLKSNVKLNVSYTIMQHENNTSHGSFQLSDSYDVSESHYANYVVYNGIRQNLVKSAMQNLKLDLLNHVMEAK